MKKREINSTHFHKCFTCIKIKNKKEFTTFIFLNVHNIYIYIERERERERERENYLYPNLSKQEQQHANGFSS